MLSPAPWPPSPKVSVESDTSVESDADDVSCSDFSSSDGVEAPSSDRSVWSGFLFTLLSSQFTINKIPPLANLFFSPCT
jgi:hypothetical protein